MSTAWSRRWVVEMSCGFEMVRVSVFLDFLRFSDLAHLSPEIELDRNGTLDLRASAA